MSQKKDDKIDYFSLDADNWSEIKDLRDFPDKPILTTVKVIDEYIPKKVAALEVAKETKQVKMVGIGLIASCFLVAIVSALTVWAGALAAGVFSIFAAIVIKKSVVKSKYFKTEYDIKI